MIAADSKSYPFLALAIKLDLEYGVVLLVADTLINWDRMPTAWEKWAIDKTTAAQREVISATVGEEVARRRKVHADQGPSDPTPTKGA